MGCSYAIPDASRPTRSAWAVALAAVVALSGCGTLAGWLGDDEDAPAPAELTKVQPGIDIDTLWSRSSTSGEGERRLELRASAAGTRVVAAGHDGDVAAHDPFTGEQLWETDTDVSISGGPGAGSGLVVVGSSGGDVVALAGENGAVMWRAQVSSEVLSAPAVSERTVVVRTIDGKLFGLDTANGGRVWVYDRTVPALTLRGTSAPVIAGGLVIAGFDSGHLAAVSLVDGRLIWETHVAAPTGRTELERLADIDADPVVSDGVVYAASYQGRVAAFDLATGRTLWRREMSSHAGIGAGRRLLYVTDEQSHVWALDRGTGASLWRQDALALRQLTRPVEYEGHVVVADFEGHVHWLSTGDGRIVGRIRAGNRAVTAPPVATDAAVYVLGRRGKLTALTLP